MKLYNTMSRTVEECTPIADKKVGLYACGPTVYDFAHIGHMRKYTMDDVLVKTLRHAGYSVTHVMNITDVGHLVSDDDVGEDKMEKGAKKYGKTVWEVAAEFEAFFWKGIDLMGVARPDVSCRATDHIKEQLEMVITLEKNGFAYVIEGDGVYFDTSKLSDYGKLAGFDTAELLAGARVEMIAGKRNPTDFALWKFEREGENRAMIWESPWAKRSFPGWHIECSAMAMRYLGEQFDIHTGGIDHIPVHHTNEIAQAEAATGKQPFVRYWVHHNFLRVDGTKMSKSLGNFYTIDDVTTKGFEPMALRLLFLGSHYRSEMNFTWENLAGSQSAWNKLKKMITQFKQEHGRTVLSEEKMQQVTAYREQFFAYMEDDLRTSEALAVVWDVVKSNIPSGDKYDLLVEFDTVLGLGFQKFQISNFKSQSIDLQSLPSEVQQLLAQREQARAEKNWDESDRLRDEIAQHGYSIKDTSTGVQIQKI